VAQQLIEMGYQAAALKGGLHAWQARYPTEPKSALQGAAQKPGSTSPD
jgi:hypothetical protein